MFEQGFRAKKMLGIGPALQCRDGGSGSARRGFSPCAAGHYPGLKPPSKGLAANPSAKVPGHRLENEAGCGARPAGGPHRSNGFAPRDAGRCPASRRGEAGSRASRGAQPPAAEQGSKADTRSRRPRHQQDLRTKIHRLDLPGHP